MKVLLIDSREGGDWSLDLLYSGLVKNLGRQNVIDYPAHDKHRIDQVLRVGDPEKDWGSERRSLAFVKNTPWRPPISKFNRIQITQMLRKGEIDVIFVDERPESYALYVELKANWFGVPVVVVAGHDKFWNLSPSYVHLNYYKDRLSKMFLSNWDKNFDLGLFDARDVNPYAWSVNFDHLWNSWYRSEEKKYDISFMGYNSHPDRERIIDHILKEWKHLNLNIVLERRPNTFELFTPKYEYFKVMQESRICLNLRGAAQDGKTLRQWEIPYVGSCMLTQRTEEKVPFPLENGVHCDVFQNMDELDESIEYLMDQPDFREELATNGHKHVMEHHTSHARVRWMLELINGS